jgi:hypothetical protein
MKNLPQNELLSAYLDGELTAAEQAETERLLAADPAARQLLDDLRALSAALQSLPQQKLGEDLSAHVLRAAERRMLTEGEPSESAPVPLSRTVLRRFVNRRTLVWTSLIVVVAVMISIQERQLQPIVADKENEEVAVALVDKEVIRSAKDNRPSTIQATPEATTSNLRAEDRKPGEKKPGSGAAASENLDYSPATKIASNSNSAGVADKRDLAPALKKAALGASAALAKRGPPAAPTSVPPQGRLNDLAKRIDRKAASSEKATPPRWYEGEGAASIGPDVLVVFCDVSADALKKKSFDKLLTANGIVSRRRSATNGYEQGDRDSSGYGAKGEGQDDFADSRIAGGPPVPSKKRGQVDEKQMGDRAPAKQAVQPPAPQIAKLEREAVLPLSADGILQRRVTKDDAELIFVEATPAQVKATLDGLAAQPKAFVSVSVKSIQDESARQIVRYVVGRERDLEFHYKSAGNRGESAAEYQREGQQAMPAAAANAAARPMAKPGAPATAKERDLAEFGGQKKADASREPERGNSEKAASGMAQNIDSVQTPKDVPSVAQGGPPPSPAPGVMSSPKRAMGPQTGNSVQQVVPTKSPANRNESSESQRHVRQQSSTRQLLAQPAPRQRVLFVLRLTNEAPPVASEVRDQPAGDAAKTAPSAPNAPTPSK